MDRSRPELLSESENRALLKRAEELWRRLQEDKLGGFSGVNRPFWIVGEFRHVIEEFGHRDTGLHWTKDQLDGKQ
jgi:hypothetical protein